MEVLAVIVAIFMGWGYLRLFLADTAPHIMAIAAFPFGVAIWVMSVIVLFALHIPYSAWSVLILVVVSLGIANHFVGTAVDKREIRVLVLWGGVMSGLDLLAQHFDLTVLSSDTMFIISMGKQFAQNGGFSEGVRGTLASFSSYLSFTEMASVSLGAPEFRGVVPLHAAATLLLIIVGGHRLLTRRHGASLIAAWGLPCLAAGALAGSYPYLWSAFYVKSAPIYSFMLLVACISASFAVIERQTRWLGLAVLALLSTFSMRLEAGLTTLPALVAIASLQGLPLRTRARLIAPVGLAFGAWYALVIVETFAHGMFGVYQLFGIGILPGLFGLMMACVALPGMVHRFPWLDKLVSLLPGLMIGMLLVFIIGFAISHIDVTAKALSAYACFFGDPYKGATVFWCGMAIATILVPFLSDRIEGEDVFVTTIIGFLLVVLAIAVQLPWKHCGTHDSTNRILVTIMPTVIFYIMARLGQGLNSNFKRNTH